MLLNIFFEKIITWYTLSQPQCIFRNAIFKWYTTSKCSSWRYCPQVSIWAHKMFVRQTCTIAWWQICPFVRLFHSCAKCRKQIKRAKQAQSIPSKEFAISKKLPREHTYNPHLQRIATDHSYISQRLEHPTKRRRLPEYLAKHSDTPHVRDNQQWLAPDGVLNYSSSVLNDGLLMLELRDAIHKDDGQRIIQRWKIVMVYFKYANYTNYAKEAFRMLANVYALRTPWLVHCSHGQGL